MWFHKIKDWEVWWRGYWRGLHGNMNISNLKYRDRKCWNKNFLVYNEGWDEGIGDRVKLEEAKFFSKLEKTL